MSQTMQALEKQRQEEAKARLDQETNDLERTFGTPHGRRVLWMLLSQAAPYSESFNDNPHRTAYNLGKRAWGRAVIVLMHRSRKLRGILRKMEDEHEETREK